MKVMLAHKYKEGQNIAGWLWSEKLDGVRGRWTGTEFVSRNNKPIFAPLWFIKIMPPNIVLDGELWIDRGEFQKTVSTVRKHNPISKEWQLVKFMVFDAIMHDMIFSQRLSYMNDNMVICDHMDVIKHHYIDDNTCMLNAFHNVISNKGEGLVLRNPSAYYEEKRSHSMLKVKIDNVAGYSMTDDATVIDYVEGKGKYVGMLGSLRVTWNGHTFNVGSGLTDAQRVKYPMIGSIVTFEYRGLTNAGKPRFPTLLCIRDYE